MANRSRNVLLYRDELSILLSRGLAPILLVPFVLALSLLISGCGFEPVYAVRDKGDQATLLRSIDLPDTRAGRYLGNQLRGRVTPGEEGGLALHVTLEETRADALTGTEGNTERINLTMTAIVRLETADAEIVEKRRFRVSSSYNRSSSELANQETEASLRNTAVDRIASDIQFLLADLSADTSNPR